MKGTESISSAQVIKKTQPEEFDLVILGGGTGSTIAAWTFAGEGKRVAVVDRKYIGGSCPSPAPATCSRRCPLPGQLRSRSPSCHQDSLWFQEAGEVSRARSPRFSGGRCVRQLSRQVNCFTGRHSRCRDSLAQGFAFQQFGDNVVNSVRIADVV